MTDDKPVFYDCVNRLDFNIPKPHVCEWCGCDTYEKLRFSYRFNPEDDPPERVILFCTSCRAREADGQLDSWGKPIRKKANPYKFIA